MATPPAASPAPANYANLVNQKRIADAARTLKDWKADAPVMQQTTANNCGAAVVAMMVRAMGQGQGLSDAQLMDKVGNGFVDGKNGVQTTHLGAMLDKAGLKATRKDAPQSWQALHTELQDNLQWGHKVAALLDANTLEKSGQKGVSSHWVLIDGTDAQGNYVVKDPGLGKTLSVSPQQLYESMQSNAKATGASGIIGVEPRVQFGHDTGAGYMAGIAAGETHEVGEGDGGHAAGPKALTAGVST